MGKNIASINMDGKLRIETVEGNRYQETLRGKISDVKNSVEDRYFHVVKAEIYNSSLDLWRIEEEDEIKGHRISIIFSKNGKIFYEIMSNR